MRLSDHLFVVGGAEAGWAESDVLDSQVYLLDTGDGFVAIDSGAGRSVARILAAVEASDVAASGIRWLLVTHGHADHAGGAAAWRDALPQLEILASREVAGWLSDGDEEATSVDRARAAGIYPADYRLRACETAPLPEREVSLGGLTLSVVPTPGHAAGHVAFSVAIDGATTLFSGDALFPGGRILLQDTWDCDVRAALRSVERLAALRPDRLLGGHLPPVLRDATTHVDRTLERIGRLLPPALLS
jgi:hydroxyacylglutathione hydrolase